MPLKSQQNRRSLAGVDLVLFAGDACKTRDPNSTYRREFARRIKRLAAGKVRPCDRWNSAQGSGGTLQ